ncbi:phospho-N-acetylmuramoyl-pentapeptide-transferase [Miniphocaeibacter massiliensis]|uniref:phospho-N-acetylmuramoyl-pentapeptide- transferase n=1 Tax=Miniphocaeibacter massiliensis TaxID=2041841 RepID=UPI000C086A0E|nr:phospho-N-acetylmuramoyl-pentapeptide-transferase [Miniphocaeibacter massiliensis]
MDLFKEEILLPILTSLILSLVLGKFIIGLLKRAHIGQSIREDGPKAHFSKAGTPTMGGIVFIISTLITLVIFKGYNYENILVILGMLGFGLVGFVDDFFKLVMKRSLGLTEMQKIIFQIIISFLLIYFASKVSIKPVGTFIIPFFNFEINLGVFAYPILAFIMIGTVNATNITDGLDGLATSVTIPVFAALTIIAMSLKSDISLFTAIFMGALIGFLVYNSNPAAVFMGDTGSMAIGGALVMVAIIFNMSLYLVIIGGVYVIETGSVILQMLSYRYRNKKRIFLMSPIHHHYELKGYKEPKIVAGFTILSVILSIITLISFL